MKGGKANQSLAPKMFKAASKGRAGFAVTKSGLELNPDFDPTSTIEVVNWFKKTKWDMSKGFPISK